jgi:hypothetical protein
MEMTPAFSSLKKKKEKQCCLCCCVSVNIPK